jgi:SOS-response transcriptional repressor LexA
MSLPSTSESMEVFCVTAIGAGSTPLTESRITGKRTIKALNNQRPFDRIIVAPIIGDSLKDEGIQAGDYAVLKLNFESSEIRDGRLVIANCPAGLVIKRFYLTDDGMVRLSSSNNGYPDLYFEFDQVKIEALVMRIDHTVYEA